MQIHEAQKKSLKRVASGPLSSILKPTKKRDLDSRQLAIASSSESTEIKPELKDESQASAANSDAKLITSDDSFPDFGSDSKNPTTEDMVERINAQINYVKQNHDKIRKQLEAHYPSQEPHLQDHYF